MHHPFDWHYCQAAGRSDDVDGKQTLAKKLGARSPDASSSEKTLEHLGVGGRDYPPEAVRAFVTQPHVTSDCDEQAEYTRSE
jgi:hypothetical protein